ncbi:MAG TPA: carbohydrate-binding family 9-like protein, partial [Nannocystaceae bacterium]|nr:carbohydrate-binding family 9-like protein [Nannocystaceae bacterium]
IVELAPGQGSATLVLPSPWHPRTAMITVARTDGVRVTNGPHTRDGLGIAGLVRVESTPTAATAVHAANAPTIDGVIDDAVWSVATSTTLLDSLDGEPVAPASTLQLAWDDAALYAAVRCDDDDVWSEYEAQDDPLWKQEVFELFLLGPGDRKRYLELQVSPRGVTFDAKFERYRQGDEAWDGQWQAAVAVDGTVARRDDRDRGWSVEVAVPWSEICAHTQTTCPPRAGTSFRINAFRFDRPRRGPAVAQALSPTRVGDFHAPENAATLELLP